MALTDWERRRYEEGKLAYAALIKFYPFTLKDLDGEQWKPIPEYEDYQVSTFGRVKSFKTHEQRIIRPQVNRSGYLYVDICKEGKVKHVPVHRLVALTFIPVVAGKTNVNHRVGCKFNCHVSNLEWCTSAENSRHAHATGLSNKGEECYQAKLTNEQVFYVRQNPDKLTLETLSEIFGVSVTTVSRIQRGLNYKDASGQIREKIHWRKISSEYRDKIRAEYQFRSHDMGQCAFAARYGVSQSTVWRILHEQD